MMLKKKKEKYIHLLDVRLAKIYLYLLILSIYIQGIDKIIYLRNISEKYTILLLLGWHYLLL